jgi:transcriptional regulator with XRE-family HTH domain
VAGLVIVRSADGLAAALRARRVELGWPLRVVGDRAGMVVQQVWAVEKGLNRPGPEVLLRITAALGCDVALVDSPPVRARR